MKNNKPVTWILAVALLGIWGTIFFSIYNSISTNDSDTGTSAVATAGAGIPPGRFEYTDDVRDPFRSTPPVVTKKTNAPKAVEPAWLPPPLKLSGILLSGKKHTAIIESSDGATYFMKEGDTLRGMKILKITPSTVNYSFMKKNGEWKLENK